MSWTTQARPSKGMRRHIRDQKRLGNQPNKEAKVKAKKNVAAKAAADKAIADAAAVSAPARTSNSSWWTWWTCRHCGTTSNYFQRTECSYCSMPRDGG